MLTDYSNQSMTWGKRSATPNTYNEYTYTDSTIAGRKETGFKLIRNARGEEVVSSARVYTESVIKSGDLIDGSIVIAVIEAIDLDGTALHCVAYLGSQGGYL